MKHKRVCKCGLPRMAGQSFCTGCHAEYMRAWRPEHPLNEDQRRKDIARSKVSVYLRRGKIQKAPCPCCGSTDVKARILDYDEPLRSIEWLCAASHAYAVRTGRLPAAAIAA